MLLFISVTSLLFRFVLVVLFVSSFVCSLVIVLSFVRCMPVVFCAILVVLCALRLDTVSSFFFLLVLHLYYVDLFSSLAASSSPVSPRVWLGGCFRCGGSLCSICNLCV